jgi:hypothetical protein
MPVLAAAESVPVDPPAGDLIEASAPVMAGRKWTLFEPVHIVRYSTTEPRQAFAHFGARSTLTQAQHPEPDR